MTVPQTPLVRAKCVLLGHPGAGKSTLARAAASSAAAAAAYTPTTALHTQTVLFEQDDLHGAEAAPPVRVQLMLVEPPALDCDRTQAEKTCRAIDAFALVYDVHDAASFSAVLTWHSWLKESAGTAFGRQLPPFVHGVLVANKADEFAPSAPPRRRVVSTHQGQQLAESLGVQYFETAALFGSLVLEPFRRVAQQSAFLYLSHRQSLLDQRDT